jgi:hypothetical protein
MPRRLIASLFLLVWLALLGVELVEQTGSFVFSDQAVDDDVDAAVLGLGLALKMSPPKTAASAAMFSTYVASFRPIAVVLEYGGEFVPPRNDATLGLPVAMCKLYCTFLI